MQCEKQKYVNTSGLIRISLWPDPSTLTLKTVIWFFKNDDKVKVTSVCNDHKHFEENQEVIEAENNIAKQVL